MSDKKHSVNKISLGKHEVSGSEHFWSLGHGTVERRHRMVDLLKEQLFDCFF